MDFEETMVNGNGSNLADDGLPEDVVEEAVEAADSLDSITDEGQSTGEEPKQQESQGTGEPGWFQKRWNKEVGKLTNQIRDEIRNEYEAQLAPLRARMLEMDARELVQKGVVKDLDTAKELVRYRQGQPQAQPVEQPRNAQGQFTSTNQDQQDTVTQYKLGMLNHQADKIKAAGGPDVRKAFMENEDIKMKVVSGEMDFYDVAEYLKQNSSRKKPPSPMRSPNGASGTNPNAIDSMSDEQFERMERKIKEGARYSLK